MSFEDDMGMKPAARSEPDLFTDHAIGSDHASVADLGAGEMMAVGWMEVAMLNGPPT